MRGCFRVIFTCHLTITLLHSYPLESAFIETYMVGLTLPAAEALGKVRRAQFLKMVFFCRVFVSFGVFPRMICSLRRRKSLQKNISDTG
jgi:hypothetical protein